MGRLSSCAKSKYETSISGKFYLHYVCTNSCSPSHGWRSQAFSSSWFSRWPGLSESHPGSSVSQVTHLGVSRPDLPSRTPHPVAIVRFSTPRLTPLDPQRLPSPCRVRSGQGSSGAVALLAPPLPGCLCFPHLLSFAPSSLPQRRRLFSKNVQR